MSPVKFERRIEAEILPLIEEVKGRILTAITREVRNKAAALRDKGFNVVRVTVPSIEDSGLLDTGYIGVLVPYGDQPDGDLPWEEKLTEAVDDDSWVISEGDDDMHGRGWVLDVWILNDAVNHLALLWKLE